MSSIQREPYKPSQNAVFWCSHCDHKKVDSDKPETGYFFIRFGHCYNDRTKQYDGDYVGVMYALCTDCNE